jgi:hypothetical protein
VFDINYNNIEFRMIDVGGQYVPHPATPQRATANTSHPIAPHGMAY